MFFVESLEKNTGLWTQREVEGLEYNDWNEGGGTN